MQIEQTLLDTFIRDYQESEMVVIALGSEMNQKVISQDEELSKLLHFYQPILDKKNYFIISTNSDRLLEDSEYNQRRLVEPILNGTLEPLQQEAQSPEEKQWDFYNKWLSATLNHKLLLIELGEGFQHLNIVRSPFEKITFINQKSKMYRINEIFPQVPKTIETRATSVSINSYTFLTEVMNYIGENR